MNLIKATNVKTGEVVEFATQKEATDYFKGIYGDKILNRLELNRGQDMERYTLNKNAEGYTDNTAMEGIKRADKNKTSKQRVTEAQEQKVIIQWCNLQSCKYPELKMIFHRPNESKRSARYGAELKRMGMAKGFPDLGLLVPNKKYAGLFIELKADKTKSMTKEQKEWLEKLNSYGYKAVRCNGSEEAIQVIKRYLNI